MKLIPKSLPTNEEFMQAAEYEFRSAPILLCMWRKGVSMRLFASILICLTSTAAIASPSAKDAGRISYISIIAYGVEIDGKVLEDRKQFATELLALEKKAGREFTDQEIEQVATEELRVRGGIPRPRCFTQSMRVLTPKGYIAIRDLKVGDEVISWDVKKAEPVVNRIEEKYEYKDTLYGRLEQVTSEGTQIEVTNDHPFYSPSLNGYEALGLIQPTSSLLQIKNCEANFVPRGQFLPNVGKGTVQTLKLKLFPHNFIVEGVLVHNKPIHIT